MRLGAQLEGGGVRFAVFSSVADAVDVCVFDESGRETRHALELGDGGVWQGHVPGTGDGTRYGFRVHGPWDPAEGLRCNAAKPLLDPPRPSLVNLGCCRPPSGQSQRPSPLQRPV
jgi:glycogen operon protein